MIGRIPRLQFVRLDAERTVVRYYNEERDCFERLFIAKEIDVDDGMLIADGNLYYEYQQRLYLLGRESEIKPERLLKDNSYCGAELQVLKVPNAAVPFRALLIAFSNGKKQRVPVLSYENLNGVVKAVLMNGEETTCYIHYSYDGFGYPESASVIITAM